MLFILCTLAWRDWIFMGNVPDSGRFYKSYSENGLVNRLEIPDMQKLQEGILVQEQIKDGKLYTVTFRVKCEKINDEQLKWRNK